MIKVPLDTIDLVILCWQVDEAMSNKSIGRKYYRPGAARRVQHDGGAAMNRSTREFKA